MVAGAGVLLAGAAGAGAGTAADLPAGVADGEQSAAPHAPQVLPHGARAENHEVSGVLWMGCDSSDDGDDDDDEDDDRNNEKL